MTTILNQSTDSMQSSSKFQCYSSKKILNPKIHMEAQKTLNNQRTPEKRKSSGGITIPGFKLQDRAIIKKEHGSSTKGNM
jgi:hypothetical protein